MHHTLETCSINLTKCTYSLNELIVASLLHRAPHRHPDDRLAVKRLIAIKYFAKDLGTHLSNAVFDLDVVRADMQSLQKENAYLREKIDHLKSITHHLESNQCSKQGFMRRLLCK